MTEFQNTPLKKATLKPLPPTRRRAVTASSEDWVVTRPLYGDRAIPRLIEPTVDDIDLVGWATANGRRIREWLLEYRALLFRGFGPLQVEAFSQFVAATSDGELLEYLDRSTPREAIQGRIYTSTVYPADQPIFLHNEGTYWTTWPTKIYFCAIEVPRSGGATPIADVRNVYRRIEPCVCGRFVERQVMYVRNYNDGFGMPWQDVFQTHDKSEVEDYCRNHDIEFIWKSNDRLRTEQVRPAVRRHPQTGETVWFNHAAFFHVSALPPELRDRLLAEFPEDGLPYNTYYGDGSPIDPADIRLIRQAYIEEQVSFPWQPGDVLLLDNMSVAHGREPFVGSRQVLAALADAVVP